MCLQVEILASLQKPKKISLKASDGRSYTMMCKPKDDLRKDCRLMEFNCLINKVSLGKIQSAAVLMSPVFNKVRGSTFFCYACSASVKMPNPGGGSYISGRTLSFP